MLILDFISGVIFIVVGVLMIAYYLAAMLNARKEARALRDEYSMVPDIEIRTPPSGREEPVFPPLDGYGEPDTEYQGDNVIPFRRRR
jgi:hypothetical protein